MSILNPPLYTENGHHSGEELRGMLQDAARRNQGIGHSTDLKVTQMAAPQGSVSVAPGSAWVTGVAAPTQGSYWIKAPDATVVPISQTGAAARSDLVVLRVEDPQYEGNRTPDIDTAYIDVIEGVANNATAVPAGYTAIPLARIDVPANTVAITDAMVTDLRKLANGRRDRSLLIVNPGAVDVAPHAAGHWYDLGAVSVPSWATSFKAVLTVSGIKVTGADYVGWMGLTLADEATIQATHIDENLGGSAHRFTQVAAGSPNVPADLRGTSKHFYMTGQRTSAGGDVQVDTGSTIVLDFEWFEGPE